MTLCLTVPNVGAALKMGGSAALGAAILAVFGDIGKAVAPHLAKRGDAARTWVAILAWAICVTISVYCSVGGVTSGRTDAASVHAAANEARAAIEQQVRGVQADISAIGAQRDVGSVDAAIASGEGVVPSVWMATKKCTDVTRTTSQVACAMFFDLTKERAKAVRLTDLKKQLPELQQKLELMPAEVLVDGNTSAWGLSEPQNAKLLTLLAEAGASLFFWLGALVGHTSPSVQPHTAVHSATSPSVEPHSRGRESGVSRTSPSVEPHIAVHSAAFATSPSVQPSNAFTAADDRLERALASHGGRLSGTYESIGHAAGLGKTTAAKLAAAGKRAGRLRVSSKPGVGTVVELSVFH